MPEPWLVPWPVEPLRRTSLPVLLQEPLPAPLLGLSLRVPLLGLSLLLFSVLVSVLLNLISFQFDWVPFSYRLV